MSIFAQSTPFLIEPLGPDATGRTMDVAALTDGRNVVVWQEALGRPAETFSDTDGAIFARIYNADGTPAAEAFQVNLFSPGLQSNPEVVATPGGGFAISYESTLTWGASSTDTDTFMVRFDNTGSVVPVTYDSVVVRYVDLDPDQPGTAETHNFITGLANGQLAAISNGNTVTIYNNVGQISARIDSLADSGFAEITGVTQLTGGNVVIAGRLAGGGAILELSDSSLINAPAGIPGLPTPVVFGTLLGVQVKDIRVTAAIPGLYSPNDPESFNHGGFMLSALIPNGRAASKLVLQSFTPWGAQIGATVSLDSAISLNPGKPDYDIVALKDGTFVVAWVTTGTTGLDIQAGHFDADGSQLGTTVLIQGDALTGDQLDPNLSVLNDGRVILTYTDLAQNPIRGITDTLHAVTLTLASASGGLQPTTGNDTINGTGMHDAISGLAGNDLIDGKLGNDVIYGGLGSDTLIGGGGNDMLNGGVGVDSLTGGEGDDGLFGGDAFDILRGEAGRDLLRGGAGIDSLFGGADGDRLDGGAGNDILNGGTGADVFILRSGGGLDRVVDFTVDDFLRLDHTLWLASGDLTAAQVLSTFGAVVGANYVLTFVGTEQITLLNFTALTAGDLQII